MEASTTEVGTKEVCLGVPGFSKHDFKLSSEILKSYVLPTIFPPIHRYIYIYMQKAMTKHNFLKVRRQEPKSTFASRNDKCTVTNRVLRVCAAEPQGCETRSL